MTTTFALNNIKHHFGATQALNIESLELQSQQIYSLHGENGAGKSTLLQCLALLLTPSSGQLFFQGQRISHRFFSLPRLRRQITLVHQAPYLFAGSVEENIRIGLGLHGISGNQIEQRIDQALTAVNLESFRQRQVRKLSGGEQKRVALARALALCPKVLLLDEPTANMDHASTIALEQVINTLPALGITVIIASHDIDQARRLNSNVIELSAGKIVNFNRSNRSE